MLNFLKKSKDPEDELDDESYIVENDGNYFKLYCDTLMMSGTLDKSPSELHAVCIVVDR